MDFRFLKSSVMRFSETHKKFDRFPPVFIIINYFLLCATILSPTSSSGLNTVLVPPENISLASSDTNATHGFLPTSAQTNLNPNGHRWSLLAANRSSLNFNISGGLPQATNQSNFGTQGRSPSEATLHSSNLGALEGPQTATSSSALNLGAFDGSTVVSSSNLLQPNKQVISDDTFTTTSPQNLDHGGLEESSSTISLSSSNDGAVNTSHNLANLTSQNLSASNSPAPATDSPPLKLHGFNVSLTTTTNLSVPTNPTIPRVQVLRPKVKFNCSQSSDCKNDALCHNGMCFCLPGFTGESCDINIDECRQFHGGQPCLNNGICVDEVNGFRCECPPGYRGERCLDLVDMCHDSPCYNNATCINHLTFFTCECKAGWMGEHCEIDKDDCAGNPCQNGAKCHDLINGYTCECPSGFTGPTCEVNVNYCANNPCMNNATCINQATSFSCRCEAGWRGLRCEIDIDECADNPCHNGAKCNDLVNSYTCDCPSGFTGPSCEVNINDCANNQCQNNATCKDLVNDYECDCLPGFAGRYCEENIDECSSSPCFHGKCTDLINGFKCTCHEGYTGEQCENDINECDLGRPVCLNGGTCENLEPSYKCHCREGWVGRNCSDISDYCKARRPCSKYGTCKNTNIPKSPFQCECQSGYIGSKCERKRDCTNECHSHHAHCVSNITCACLPGRKEERIMCEYVASCDQVEGELCLNGGSCKNLETGGYQCICEEPFYGPICQFMAERQFDSVLFIIITCVVVLLVACTVVSLLVFRSVRKARATRGTYSPSTQEKFGNSASYLLEPPIPERLI